MKSFFRKKIVRTIETSILLPAVIITISCGNKEPEDRYSIRNIGKASVEIVKSRGFSALSGEAINEEIDRMYSSPEDSLQKKTTIRQQNFDGSNNYRIIFEDMISNDQAEAERRYKDPVKQQKGN
jgi:hypothetical protein